MNVADEVFAIVDVLDSSAALRRAFTDPASSAEARVALGERIFTVSAQARAAFDEAITQRWRNGHLLSDALERDGVRFVLADAADAGQLDELITQVQWFAGVVREHDGLREALRDDGFDVAARRELVASLTRGKVSAGAEALLQRGVTARERTYALTLEHYLALAAELRQRQIAHVSVARPLTAEQEARLRAALTTQTGRDIDLQIEIDPALLGGIRVQFGDDRIDSTVAARLDDVQRQLTA